MRVDDLVGIKDLFHLGLFSLSLIPVLGVYGLNKMLSRENCHLEAKSKLNHDIFKKFNILLEKCLYEKKDFLDFLILAQKEKEKYSKEEDEVNNKYKPSPVLNFFEKNFSSIITYLFIGGQILILLSLLNI